MFGTLGLVAAIEVYCDGIFEESTQAMVQD